ncbi:MAG: sigma-54 dependent transcriptional regulator [Syntrophaceae bacterium]
MRMVKFSLALIDDEESIREGICMALVPEYDIEAFATAETALERIKTSLPDLILLDIGLPGMNGIDALRKIREISPDILVIMITAYEDIDTVISAMKLGAYDYVVKPIHMDSLMITIGNALESIRLRKEIRVLQEGYLRENLPCFIAESNEIQDIMDFIASVAKSPDTPILILGETGTGKELIASSIHYRSPNFKGPYVTVNCATMPRDLIESELFGYEKGAFSGASPLGKKGLLEDAAEGTLFLDEVGDLSLEAQAKLLRFLENGEFYRVGSTQKLHIRTRVVSATNKDLGGMIEQGLFRSDLFYRLSVITVHVPSLNERPGDILPLANHFLVRFSQKFDKKFIALSAEAQDALKRHPWSGNVRELKNLIERGVLVGNGPELTLKDLGIDKTVVERGDIRQTKTPSPSAFPPIPPEGYDFEQAEKAFEKFYIEEALRMADGNESKAARLLHMNHHTFRYRRKKYV